METQSLVGGTTFRYPLMKRSPGTQVPSKIAQATSRLAASCTAYGTCVGAAQNSVLAGMASCSCPDFISQLGEPDSRPRSDNPFGGETRPQRHEFACLTGPRCQRRIHAWYYRGNDTTSRRLWTLNFSIPRVRFGAESCTAASFTGTVNHTSKKCGCTAGSSPSPKDRQAGYPGSIGNGSIQIKIRGLC